MKKILLLGDSIRMGYDRYVKERMEPLARVFYPEENCRFAAYMLRNIHNWASQLHTGHDLDAVHWAVGHWDTVRIYGDECLTTPEQYRDTLRRIAERIRFLFPQAKQVFALAPPVLEEGYIEEFEMRYNADVRRYNDIARETLEPMGVIINDLYAPLADKPDSYHSDQSHYYTAEATVLLGDQVSGLLCDLLDLDKTRLLSPDPQSFVITCYKNDSELYRKEGNYYEPIE